MRRVLWASTVSATAVALGAEPHTNTNVVSSADDAFGITLGLESLGLYSQSSVRGFSPLIAGNVRVDGFYFDQQGVMVDRLVSSTRIRVGLSAVDFPWPAPTGIVDYTLRQPQDRAVLTSTLDVGPYGSREVDLEGSVNRRDKLAGIAAGVSYRFDEDMPGFTGRFASFGILPQWTPTKDLAVRAFWGLRKVTDYKTLPGIYVGTGRTVPRIVPRYFGQVWSGDDFYSEHYGVLVKAKLVGPWSVRAGAFRSIFDLPRSYADLYLNTSSQGIGNHELIAEPDQRSSSTSGEVQLSYTSTQGTREQEFDVGMRGRDVSVRYGGSDTVDFGPGAIGQLRQLKPPPFVFGPTATDHIREYSAGFSYTLRWRDHFKFNAGLQRPRYSSRVADPVAGSSATSLAPWLYNSSVVLSQTKRLAFFAALTRGLEDSGVAPGNAVNRGAVLGAARSSQKEAGMRYTLTPSVALVAAAFDIQKPYFALDSHGTFGDRGVERHRGLELSLSGELTSGLHVVVGALLTSPEVEANPAAAELIGRRPVGQASRMEQLSLDYRTSWLPGLSLDCTYGALGDRAASVDNRVEIPGYWTLNVGARYQMSLGPHPLVFRVQVLNVTNRFNWSVANDGGLTALEARRVGAYLVADW